MDTPNTSDSATPAEREDPPSTPSPRRKIGLLRRAVSLLGWCGPVIGILCCLGVLIGIDRIPHLSLWSYTPLYPAAVLVVIGSLITIRRRIAIPLGLLIAPAVLYLDGFGFGIGRLTTSREDSIRLISYNIEDWHGPNKQGFYDLIASVNPHMLVLQEVWGPWDRKDHRWDPIRHYEWGDTDGRHVGLLAPFTPVRYEKLGKYGNAVLCEKDGFEFWVASVQFPRGIDAPSAMQFMPTDARVAQGEFAQLMREWLADKPDVLVVGDFNALAHSWFIRSLGLRNPWITHGVGIGGTWKVDLPVAKIDHVFYKGRLRPAYATTVHLEGFSNHRGLVYEFHLPPTEHES
jgi:hypothetical protein